MMLFTLKANNKNILLSPIGIDIFASNGRLLKLEKSSSRIDKQYTLSDGKTVLYGKRLSKVTLKISIECNDANLEYIKDVLNSGFVYSVKYTTSTKLFQYEMKLSGGITENKIYNANEGLNNISFTLEEM